MSALVERVNLALLLPHLLSETMVELEGFLKLQLQEGVLLHVRGADAGSAVLVVHGELRIELERSTLADSAIECLMRLRWPELARNEGATGVVSAGGDLSAVHGHSLIQQFLNHRSELLVVLQELVERCLVDAASAARLD